MMTLNESTRDESYSWPAYRLFVVKEMKRMAEMLEKLDEKIDRKFGEIENRIGVRVAKVDERLRRLEIKAAQWGAIAGLVGTIIIETAKLILVAVFKK